MNSLSGNDRNCYPEPELLSAFDYFDLNYLRFSRNA